MQKAVFIDRDGVINSDEGHYYVYRTQDFVLNARVVEGLKMLKSEGFLLVLITNQGGVAKGKYTEEDIFKVHQYMQHLLKEENVCFDAIYYCPHHDSVSECSCRKPKPGMILQAMEDLIIDASMSFLIGDSERDIQAGEAAGLKGCYRIPKNTSIIPFCHKILTHSIC